MHLKDTHNGATRDTGEAWLTKHADRMKQLRALREEAAIAVGEAIQIKGAQVEHLKDTYNGATVAIGEVHRTEHAALRKQLRSSQEGDARAAEETLGAEFTTQAAMQWRKH